MAVAGHLAAMGAARWAEHEGGHFFPEENQPTPWS
jgi:hypothetical protein